MFWDQWSMEYLQELQMRNKWKTASQNVKEGLLVLVKEDNVPVMSWPMGRIVKTYPGKDDHVRVVDVKTASGIFKRSDYLTVVMLERGKKRLLVASCFMALDRVAPPEELRSLFEASPKVQQLLYNHIINQLYLYDGCDSLLVTHDDATLYILNLDKLKVEAVARGFRKILDFCVFGKEIFLLEGDHSLLRLAPLPEPPNKKAKVIFNPLMPPPVPLMGLSSQSERLESPLKLQAEPVLQGAEECFEVPPGEQLDLNVPIELAVESPLAPQNRRLEIFRRIGEMDFDKYIIHTSRKTCAEKAPAVSSGSGIVEIGHETHELRLPLTNAATLMEASYYQMENNGLASTLAISDSNTSSEWEFLDNWLDITQMFSF
ncbi:hypothetical protein KR059_000422 [Drosophila kikkawai]|nr:hypothetical protein KR059_000422 [Drosophila kikkawai]